MIFWIGLVMTALSLATLVGRAHGSLPAPPSPACGRPRAGGWSSYVVVLLALYAWLLPALGFITTTVLLLFVLFVTIDRQSWIAPPLGAVLATAAAYIVFHRWLGTQLPAGEAERWLGEHLPLIFGRS